MCIHIRTYTYIQIEENHIEDKRQQNPIWHIYWNQASGACHDWTYFVLSHFNSAVYVCSIPASVREGVKILTPPPLFQDFLGVGGLDPLGHNLLQKDWIFFLNFIFQGHFGICWLKLHVLEHYTMNYGVKKDHFVMRRGVGHLCLWLQSGAIAGTGAQTPSPSLYTSKGWPKHLNFQLSDPWPPPPVKFVKFGGGGSHDGFLRLPLNLTSGEDGSI